jgi:hypothetical protein
MISAKTCGSITVKCSRPDAAHQDVKLKASELATGSGILPGEYAII